MFNLAYMYQALRLKELIYHPLPLLQISDESVLSISRLTIAVQRTKMQTSLISISAHASVKTARYNTTSFQLVNIKCKS
jgi:hypothetical protein